MDANEMRELLKEHPCTQWVPRGDHLEPVADPSQPLICDGPPMRYSRPKPLDAEQVEKIVRETMERLLEQAKRRPSKTAPVPGTAVCGGREMEASTETGPVPQADSVTATAGVPPSAWLSPQAACAYAKCSRQTLWRWRRQGLRVGRGGRIQRSDLDAWLGGTVERQPDGCDGGELLRLSQAAAAAGVSLQTIYRWRNDGLKVQRRGRFVRIRAGVLDKFLRSRS